MTRPDEHFGIRLRAAYQVLERLRERHNLICKQVKSHTGILGNELADAIANAQSSRCRACVDGSASGVLPKIV